MDIINSSGDASEFCSRNRTCLSGQTQKDVRPFYVVSIPGKVSTWQWDILYVTTVGFPQPSIQSAKLTLQFSKFQSCTTLKVHNLCQCSLIVAAQSCTARFRGATLVVSGALCRAPFRPYHVAVKRLVRNNLGSSAEQYGHNNYDNYCCKCLIVVNIYFDLREYFN